jgi:hypothetical protein
MKQLTNEAFSPEESKKIYDNFLSIVGTRRDKLVKRYGSEAEKVAYAKAVKQVKKQAEEKPMEKEIEEGTCGYGVDGEIGDTPAGPMLIRLKEMVKDALKNPKKADLNKDGKLSDYEKKRGAAIEKSMQKELETPSEEISDEPISEEDKMSDEETMEKVFDKTSITEIIDPVTGLIAGVGALIGMGIGVETIQQFIHKKAKEGNKKYIDFYNNFQKVKRSGVTGGVTIKFYDEKGNLHVIPPRNPLRGRKGADGKPISEEDKMSDEERQLMKDLGDSFGANRKALEKRRKEEDAKRQADYERFKKSKGLDEDLDLGHTDDEPGMLKSDLYRIGKYAMELYKMVDKFDEMDGEVDFPHWWQTKITKSKSMLVSAKHYLDFEMKEPQIDAMVDVASEEGVIDEKKEPLKEYTDQNFSGKELIGSLRSPDMFGKQLFSDLFPNSVKSEGEAIQSLNAFDELQYPPNVFVAVGYQNFDADVDGVNEKFQIHQSLYYNHNYDDVRSPGVVKLTLYKKLGDRKEEEIGQMLAKSSEVSKDMKNLDKTGDFVSENKIDEGYDDGEMGTYQSSDTRHYKNPQDMETYLSAIKGMTKVEAIEHLGEEGLSSSMVMRVINKADRIGMFDVQDMFDINPRVRGDVFELKKDEKLKPSMGHLSAKDKKKVVETVVKKLSENPETVKSIEKLQPILFDILKATEKVDKSQDDTEADVEELDKSIDYLSAALTGDSALKVAADQTAYGRLASPSKKLAETIFSKLR